MQPELVQMQVQWLHVAKEIAYKLFALLQKLEEMILVLVAAEKNTNNVAVDNTKKD